MTKVDRIRFGDLKKRIGDITNTMLANALKELEQNGIVLREQFNESPPHVEYSLSDSGKEMYRIFLKWLCGEANIYNSQEESGTFD